MPYRVNMQAHTELGSCAPVSQLDTMGVSSAAAMTQHSTAYQIATFFEDGDRLSHIEDWQEVDALYEVRFIPQSAPAPAYKRSETTHIVLACEGQILDCLWICLDQANVLTDHPFTHECLGSYGLQVEVS